MPVLPAQELKTFTLTAHTTAPCAAVRRLGGTVARMRDSVRVSYRLEGEISRLYIPARHAPRVADDLWRRTCFELFVSRKDRLAYRELNFSPSGEWAAYAFARYRQRDAETKLAPLDPRINLRQSAETLELEAVVPLDRLSLGDCNAALALALCAVIEERNGRLSYWALTHPLEKPDFHHPDAFVLEFDEIRH